MYNGKPIKDKRKELGLSAKELAEIIGVKEGNIYKWEKGTKPHDPENFLKIQNWLSGKTETVTDSKNGAVVSNKAQHGDQSKKPGLPADLIERLTEEIISIRATLKVISLEIAPLIAKENHQSKASASLQLEKDISAEVERLKALDRK